MTTAARPTYDLAPHVAVPGDYTCHCGWDAIADALRAALTALPDGTRPVLSLDCYSGVFSDDVRAQLAQRLDCTVIDSKAALKPAAERDALVAPNGTKFLDEENTPATIATGSTRRRAQWLAKYPGHQVVNLRGNVNTRLQKVETNDWNGAIFAAAGLKRIDLHYHITQYLEWMIPAPAQGAMAVMVREEDKLIQEIVAPLSHAATEHCTRVERELLHVLEAGCSAPVGAYATLDEDKNELYLKAVALSHEGSKKFEVAASEPVDTSDGMGARAAHELLDKGAAEIIDQIRL